MNFERIRTNPVLRSFHDLPWVTRIYHFSLALYGAMRTGFPSRRIKVIGITGTKGKTSAVELLVAIFEAAGRKTALLSSVHIKVGEDSEKNRLGNSMPGRGFIQKFLRRAADAGCEFAVLEVTSQGVVTSRHRFIHFASAAITNIAPEHIEAHGSFENYRNAKFTFLKYVARQGTRVFVNSEDNPSHWFKDNLPGDSVALYSLALIPDVPNSVWETMPGKFSRENAAAAVAIAKSFGITDEEVRRGLISFKGVEGRAEFVQKEPFKVVVDYAHTPESLRAIYSTVRDLVPGNMICVLGAAGGGRDKWKRPAMGEIAASLCDEIILTNEDPYDEKPEEILSEIAAGAKIAKNPIAHILDRKEAIKEAIGRAKPGDAVIITGKGSELYLHLANGEKIEWSDREAAKEALKTRSFSG
jgi:UDP-N-acetylmuramoyl-L-alanyl-D-glutamate--2,6-diaminopimelate ligase